MPMNSRSATTTACRRPSCCGPFAVGRPLRANGRCPTDQPPSFQPDGLSWTSPSSSSAADPPGLTLGALLARAGIEFLLVEKNPGTCTHPHAHAISGRTMEIFRSLDIHEEVYRRGLDMLRFGGLRIVTSLAGSELARIAPRLDPEQIAAMMSFSPCPGTSTPQDLIEPLLAGILAGGPGQLRFNNGTRRVSAGRRRRCRNPWHPRDAGNRSAPVGWWPATAPRAASARNWALPRRARPRSDRSSGIYFHADLMRWTRDRPAMLYWTIDSELPATFIALDGRERWSLHVSWDPETESLATTTQERCIDIARHCIGADVEIDLRSVRPWTMSARIAATFRSGRVLLAGDAAHPLSPDRRVGAQRRRWGCEQPGLEACARRPRTCRPSPARYLRIRAQAPGLRPGGCRHQERHR